MSVKEKLVELLQSSPVDHEGNRGVGALADHLIANGVTVQDSKVVDFDQFNKWIPVTERLPDLIPCSAGTGYSEAVNVLTSGRKVMVAVWDGVDWLCAMDYWDAWGEVITHWTPVLLPLPELSKEG